jgi:ABC-type nitrate/sulfonate/bicarbonate transport system substrate-binding protein
MSGDSGVASEIHYSRCIMVPTSSSLAFQLGLLGDGEAAALSTPVRLELGDYDHKDDRYWLRHAGLTKHIWARSKGADTLVLGFSRHVGSQPIYVLPNAGIDGPGDLKGRRLALIRTGNQAFDVDRSVYLKPYYAALKAVGLSLGDVSFVETPMDRELVKNAAHSGRNYFQRVSERFVTQLLRGEVDAIATPLPPEIVGFFDLKRLYDTRDDRDPAVRTELRAIVAADAVVRDHRDIVVQLLSRLVAAERWGTTNTDAVLPLLAKDIGVADAILRGRGIDGDALSRLELDDELIEIAAAKKRFLLDARMIDTDFDLRAWVDPTLLRDARVLAAQPG